MSPQEQANVMCFWNALVVAVSLYSFGYSLLVSLCIAVIILISSLIGDGRRHLLRAGFGMMVIAIAVDRIAPSTRAMGAVAEISANNVGKLAHARMAE